MKVSGLLLIFLVFISCVDVENRYQMELGKLDYELQVFFPQDIDTNEFSIYFITRPNFSEYHGEIVTIYLTFYPPSFEAEKNKIIEQSLAVYGVANKCNVIPNCFQNRMSAPSQKGKEWLYNGWLKEIDTCSTSRYPIPNFMGAGNDGYEHKFGLSEDYKLFVMQCEEGQILPEKFYGDTIIMPDKWKRGYSNGVAISDLRQEMIWWFIAW